MSDSSKDPLPSQPPKLLQQGWKSSPWFRPGLACAGILILTVLQLRLQGRRWWCACGNWWIWTGDVFERHNSQHWLDPYSLSHLLHGVLFSGLLVLVFPRMSLRWWFVWAVGLESVWEILENTSFAIERYRHETAARGYEGDSIANAFADILCCAAGFWIAHRLRFWKSLALFVAIEILLLIWIRDSLILNVLTFLFPLDAIEAWQSQG